MALSLNPSWRAERARGHDIAQLGRAAWRALRTRLRPARRADAAQPVSLAVFDVSELPELREVFGAVAARDTVAVIRRVLLGIDPLVGSIYRTTATSFVVLLPGYDAKRALAAVHAALGETLSIESEWQGAELIVVPDFLIRSLSDPSASVAQLQQQMLGEIVDKQRSARRRHDYLRRERESHLSSGNSSHARLRSEA